jgi:hypothetical protein
LAVHSSRFSFDLDAGRYNRGVRRLVVVAAAVLAGSCGGSPPTAPDTGAPAQPRAVVLPAGPYTLAIGLSIIGLPVCQNGVCTSSSVCTGNPVATTAQFNVSVERSGDEAAVRVPGAGTQLLLTLRLAPTSVTGSIAGAAADAAGSPLAASGTVTGGAPTDTTIAVLGNIDGQVTAGSGGCSNNGHSWALRAR